MSRPTTVSGRPTRRELYRTNVEGTRHLLAAAAQAGVKKIIYTSSVATMGIPHGRYAGR